MALLITLNAILAFGVLVVVISPLVWAILTQHRDAPEVRVYRQRRPQPPAEAPRSIRSSQYQPVARPT